MKLHAQPVSWAHRPWSDEDVVADRDCPAREYAAASPAECESGVCRHADGGSLSTPMRIVGVLAFCQTIFFLVLFLFICARAGAATESKSAPTAKLTLSTYTTKTVRDPFGSEAPMPAGLMSAAPHTVSLGSLKLMGILYSAASPAALINGQLVELNKPIKVPTRQGEAEIKALAITREMVQLEVGGQKMELRLGGGERDKESK